MQLAIYRSASHATYPEEALIYCYAFQPIAAEEHTRDGLLLDWTDSAEEPFLVVEVPDGSRVAYTDDEWQLLIPDRSVPIFADEVYELAVEQAFGLSIILGPQVAGRRHSREA